MSETEQKAARPRPKTSDVIGTVILGVVGAVAVVMGLGYGFTVENGQVGPGFLPVLTGGFIVVATVLELIRMFFASSSPIEGSFMETVEHVEDEARAAIAEVHGGSADSAEAELDTFGRSGKQQRSAIVKIFLVMLAALLLMPVLGLLISLAAMTLTLLVYVERKPWITSLLATAGALAFFYLIFVQGLHVPLPTGLLGII